jgi:mono/diheme cytochrome c family protein
MWKLVKWVLGIVILVIGGGVAYVMLALPKSAEPRQGNVDRSAAKVERGKYLFEAVSACADCHSDVDTTRFGYPPLPGGFAKGKVLPIPGSSWTLVAPNLTSDPETGVGNWTDGQLIRAIREGIGHDGRPLFPQMPYAEYANHSDEDVEALVAYIRTIPPVKNSLPKTAIGFPMNLIMRTIPKPVGSVPPVDRSDKVSYGRHLTKVAGCQFCHTPFERGQSDMTKLFAGGHSFELETNARAVSANITPDQNTGIGAVSEKEFLDKFYQYKEYVANGSKVVKPENNTVMPWLTYSRMEVDDLKAIYAYLRTVPAVSNAVVTHPDAPEEKSSQKK